MFTDLMAFVLAELDQPTGRYFIIFGRDSDRGMLIGHIDGAALAVHHNISVGVANQSYIFIVAVPGENV